MLINNQDPFNSTRLISLDKYFDEMVKLHNLGNLPKVMLLNGKKGIGKFTLVFHFLNYVYSKNENTHYNIIDKVINTDSNFYKSILNGICPDVIFLRTTEGKNIKLDEVRHLKSTLTSSSLTGKPRFIIIDEVEFLNLNSANALLKILEEPGKNNYFILINNLQADLIETISSRCLKNNIFLNSIQRIKIIDHLVDKNKINCFIKPSFDLTPGVFIIYNELFDKYKIDIEENITSKLNKLLNAYKKDKNKVLINMSYFLIDHFFYELVKNNEKKIEFLLNLKSIIVHKINNFVVYNLSINSVLNYIDLKIKNAR